MTNLGDFPSSLLVAQSYPQCFLRFWPVLRIHSNFRLGYRITFPEVILFLKIFLENVTGDELSFTDENAECFVCSSNEWDIRPQCLSSMVSKLFTHLFGNHNYNLKHLEHTIFLSYFAELYSISFICCIRLLLTEVTEDHFSFFLVKTLCSGVYLPQNPCCSKL